MGTKKLTDADAEAIRTSRRPKPELADEYGVTVGYIHEIQVGRARNPGHIEPTPRRQYNVASGNGASIYGHCDVCGVTLHRSNLTTDGDGHVLAVCDRGHRVRT